MHIDHRNMVRRRLSIALGLVSVLTVGAAGLGARYAIADIVEVPVSRVIENLEALVKQQPNDVGLRVNLARTHAMAFALKSSTVRINRGQENLGPAEPRQQNVMPAETATTKPEEIKAAREHLDKAIIEFEHAIALEPTHSLARLGYAWALQCSGQTAKAIEAYRWAIRIAFPPESAASVYLMDHQTVTEEAVRFLIPLLDPVKDRAEIDTLKAQVAKIQPLKRAITPVAIPLRDGMTAFDMVDSSARVRFDLDGSGVLKRWTWIAKDAGWLVIDLHHRRTITSGLQLFGSVTFWLFWDNGYNAMRALDDNFDGRLSGRELEGLAIWQDRDSDGVSDPGEVRPVGDWKIVELSCVYQRDPRHPDEIAMSPAGVQFANGTTRATFDVVLHEGRETRAAGAGR